MVSTKSPATQPGFCIIRRVSIKHWLAVACTFISTASAQIAVQNVTAIDPRSGNVLPNVTVLIDGQTISRIGPASTLKPPAKFPKIDGTGKYLIPGLWDSHVHLTKAGESSLSLFIANGVTSVRDMGSDPDEVIRWRREIESANLCKLRKTFVVRPQH